MGSQLTHRPYHAMFIKTMLIRPTAEELKNFGEPDWTIYNAGDLPADESVEVVYFTFW